MQWSFSTSATPIKAHPCFGKTIFVELKTEVGRLAKVQKWQRSEMEKRGADCRVLFGMDAVKDFLREVFPA